MMRGVPSVSKKQQPTVVIYRPADATGSSHRQLEALGCRVVVVADRDGLLGSMRAFHPVHAVLAASLHGEYLDAASLREQQELRIVAKYTIGVDDIDLEAASDLGILVTHSPAEANWGGVAEGTIALMLALLKKVGARDTQVRAGEALILGHGQTVTRALRSESSVSAGSGGASPICSPRGTCGCLLPIRTSMPPSSSRVACRPCRLISCCANRTLSACIVS
jgi:lactate dehydrogenase-like 2-hydroxyacid dehydrogenase